MAPKRQTKPTAAGTSHGKAARTSRRKSGQKRQTILDAAARVFRRRGYAQATLNEIAQEAGTQAGSLYYYFPSREALVEEVILHSMVSISDAVTAAIAEQGADASPLQRMRIAIRAHTLTILGHSDYYGAFRRIFDQVPDQMRERFIKSPRAYGAFWTDLLEEGKRAGEIRPEIDSRVVRLLLLGCMTWMTQWYRPKGSNTPEQLADAVFNFFLRGAATSDGADACAHALLEKP